MVVAIKQDVINFQLSHLHGMGLLPKKVDVVLAGGHGELHADLAAPTILLGLRDSPRLARFVLRMPSGSFTHGQETFKFTDWAFAFDVNLDLQKLEADQLKAHQAVPPEVKNHLTQFDPAMFTIQHLFLDFQDADLANYDPEHSRLIKPNGSKLDDAQFQQLKALLQEYFKDLKGTANPYILGYSVDAGPTANASAIEPTKSTFSTVRDPKVQGNSTLNFLLMTGHQEFPSDPSIGVFKDNWVSPDAEDGSMLIAPQIFWEGWIIPSLNLGPGTTVTRNDIINTFPTAGGGIAVSVVFAGHGWSMHRFEVTVPNHPVMAWDEETRTYVESGVTENETERRDTQLTFTSEPPKLKLALTGEWVHSLRQEVWWGHCNMYGTVKWNAALSLAAGSDGQLAFVRDSVSQEKPVATWEGAYNTRANPQDIADNLGVLVTKEIQNMALQAFQQRLFLPAGNIFFFKNIRLLEGGLVSLDLAFKS